MEGNGIPGPVKKEMSHRDMALFLKEYKSSGIGGRNMVTQRTFGTLPSGEEVQIYHLENKSGAFAAIPAAAPWVWCNSCKALRAGQRRQTYRRCFGI